MKRIIKYDNLLNPINHKKIDDLCKSISENCDGRLGWEQLTKLSGFTHKELIALFQLYCLRRMNFAPSYRISCDLGRTVEI